jgi:transposase
MRYHVKEGEPIARVARRFGVSRQTVYNQTGRLEEGEGGGKKVKVQRPSKLDSYKSYIETRLKAFDLTAVKLYEEIKKLGYGGGYTIVKRFVSGIRENQVRQITERFETLPGVQAQVDFGECGVIEINGERKKLYVFVMVLGYSRMMYTRFVTSMKRPVFLTCLREGFERLGIPKELLLDNLKAAVDAHPIGEGAQVRFNPEFLAFCDHYGVVPKAAPPYWPRVKGKVERGVGYVKGNFLLGLKFTDLADLNQQVDAWTDNVANTRIHGTTGERPIDRYQNELPHLNPAHTLPTFDTRPIEMRQVSNDSFVSYRGTRYSVDPKAVGKTVWLRPSIDGAGTRSGAGGGQSVDGSYGFEVYLEGTLVAVHRIAAKGTRSVMLPEHEGAIKELSRKASGQKAKPKFQQVPSTVQTSTAQTYRAGVGTGTWPTELNIQVQVPSLHTYTPLMGGEV